MGKRIVIVLLVLLVLSGCQNRLRVACNYQLEDKSIDLDIKAINDDISSINVRTCFEIPYYVLYDQDKLEFLNSQLDDSYHYEDNLLIREYEIPLDRTYSLDMTLADLRKKRFYCE